MSRRVSARWTGAQGAVTDLGGVSLGIGKDAPPPRCSGDGGDADRPLPTDVLLAAVASCFAIALAFTAAKRDLELPGLKVDAIADYEGLRISNIVIEVSTHADPDLVQRLIPPAERLCYVTNTLRHSPQIVVRQQ